MLGYMPMLMSLEGLSMRPIDRFKQRASRAFSGLGATAPATPTPPVVPMTATQMYTAPFKAHPIILLLGIFGGMMYAARRK